EPTAARCSAFRGRKAVPLPKLASTRGSSNPNLPFLWCTRPCHRAECAFARQARTSAVVVLCLRRRHRVLVLGPVAILRRACAGVGALYGGPCRIDAATG